MKNIYCLFLHLGLSTAHNFWGDFLLNNVQQKPGKFPLLIPLLLAASGCGVKRAWSKRDVRKRTLSHAFTVKYRAVASRLS